MADGGPEKINQSVDPAKSVQGVGDEQSQAPGNFQSFMQDGQETQKVGGKPEGPSPFDLAAGKQTTLPGPTHESVLGQMNSASSVIAELQSQMGDKNLTLRQSQKYLLRNKLANANQNIRIAAGKVGVDAGPSIPQFSRQSPVDKFLGMLSDSQSQLSNAQSKIQNLNANGQSISPGDILLIQVKLSKAQQELEYCSVLVSTAVGSLKNLFNIQL